LPPFAPASAKHDFVTVDTEFLRETTYWPELCLIQMAGPEDEGIVDPLAKGIDLKPFFELMADASVVKVFHAARQDIEIMVKRGDLVPHPLSTRRLRRWFADLANRSPMTSLSRGSPVRTSTSRRGSPTGAAGR
jgi:ribonuclease D